MKENLFEKYFSGQKGLYACLFILMLVCFLVFNEYILFHSVYLFKDIGSDTINGYYPNYINISEYLRTEGFPKWSFNNGMGQNIFSFFLRDPIDIIVYSFRKENIPYVIIYKELFKIIMSGIVFYFYLRKLSFTTYTSIIGSMLYSFSGFMVLGSGWGIFTFEALSLALLLFSFEKIFQNNNWYLFPFVIALIGISMPFNLYLYGIFIIVYILFRYFLEKGMELKGLYQLIFKMGLLTLLGLGISSMFLFSNIGQLLESPRVGGDASLFHSLFNSPVFATSNKENFATTIMRFFSNDLLGTGSSFKGWGNYLEAPLFYSGLLSLLLIPQVFGFLNKKQKIIYAAFIVIWIIPIIFPFFRYAFWLFSGDYYRAFSLCVATGFIFLGLNSLNYLDRLGKVNLITLLITLFFLFVFLFYRYFLRHNPIDKELRFIVSVFLIIYAVLLYLHGFYKTKLWAQFLLILTLFIELSYFSSITVNKRSVISSRELKQKEGYNDYTNEAIAYLNKTDNSFYRIDKNYSSGPAMHGSINDSQAQNYKGTSSYSSFNQMYYIKFLQGMEIIHGNVEVETRWVMGFSGKTLLETIGSVKYVLSKLTDNSYLLYTGFDSVSQFGNVKIFRNKNYLPLGFTYDKYLPESDFRKVSNLNKQPLLFNAIVVDDENKDRYKDLTLFSLKDTLNNYNMVAFENDIKKLKQDTLVITKYNHNAIKGKINIDKKKLLFFSIPYDKGWTATVDGKEAKIELVDFGFQALILDRGEHSIELNYTVPYLKAGIIVSVLSLLVFLIVVLWEKKKNRNS